MSDWIYLDNNATTRLSPAALQAMVEGAEVLGNPSSVHGCGRAARKLVQDSRNCIARYLDVHPDRLLFTSGGTEGVNLALFGITDRESPGHIVASSVEHAAVEGCLHHLEATGWEVTRVLPERMSEHIRSDTKMLILMAANNETGRKHDICSLAKIAEEHGIPLVVDAVASFGREKPQIVPGVSVWIASAHKLHGPKGAGLLVVDPRCCFAPRLFGGPQERGLRAGTENVLGIVGFAAAVRELAGADESYWKKIRALRDAFEERLCAKGALCNGEGDRVCNTSNLAFPGIDAEALLINLDQRKIAVSYASACSSGGLEPSRVLLQMGLPLERVLSSLRFSFARDNSMGEVERAAKVIEEELLRLRN